MAKRVATWRLARPTEMGMLDASHPQWPRALGGRAFARGRRRHSRFLALRVKRDRGNWGSVLPDSRGRRGRNRFGGPQGEESHCGFGPGGLQLLGIGVFGLWAWFVTGSTSCFLALGVIVLCPLPPRAPFGHLSPQTKRIYRRKKLRLQAHLLPCISA